MTPAIALNRWAQGIDYCVAKVGRKWAVTICEGFPLFATKREAYAAATSFVVPRESRVPSAGAAPAVAASNGASLARVGDPVSPVSAEPAPDPRPASAVNEYGDQCECDYSLEGTPGEYVRTTTCKACRVRGEK